MSKRNKISYVERQSFFTILWHEVHYSSFFYIIFSLFTIFNCSNRNVEFGICFFLHMSLRYRMSGFNSNQQIQYKIKLSHSSRIMLCLLMISPRASLEEELWCVPERSCRPRYPSEVCVFASSESLRFACKEIFSDT